MATTASNTKYSATTTQLRQKYIFLCVVCHEHINGDMNGKFFTSSLSNRTKVVCRNSDLFSLTKSSSTYDKMLFRIAFPVLEEPLLV